MIHVVDDDEAIRSSLKLLGEARGWSVLSYANASDYLDSPVTEAHKPDCLVLDLHMPGMNGAELLESLKAAGRTTAAIILTAWPDSELARRASRAGARTILAKPFAPGDWLRAVEATLLPA